MNIIWTPNATLQLEEALDYIQQDSPANAQKVYSTIIALIEKQLNNQNDLLLINTKREMTVAGGHLKSIVIEFHIG